jgi:hypothetical protein
MADSDTLPEKERTTSSNSRYIYNKHLWNASDVSLSSPPTSLSRSSHGHSRPSILPPTFKYANSIAAVSDDSIISSIARDAAQYLECGSESGRGREFDMDVDGPRLYETLPSPLVEARRQRLAEAYKGYESGGYSTPALTEDEAERQGSKIKAMLERGYLLRKSVGNLRFAVQDSVELDGPPEVWESAEWKTKAVTAEHRRKSLGRDDDGYYGDDDEE